MKRAAPSRLAVAIGGLVVMGFTAPAWAQPSPGAAMQGLVGGAPSANHAPPSRPPDRNAQTAKHDVSHHDNRVASNSKGKNAKDKKK